MAIPKVSDQNILKAFEYIDQYGLPDKNVSYRYSVISDSGKEYPPKYVIAVANYLENGGDIIVEGYNAVAAKNHLISRGFNVIEKNNKYELVVTSESITSTDERFNLNDLTVGGMFEPTDVYFANSNGDITRRKRNKSENKMCNLTLPRLACQIFEDDINNMSEYNRERFPVCKYTDKDETIVGIFNSVDEYKDKTNRRSFAYCVYTRENGPTFVFYSWNTFSTLIFVQECLRRFGNLGDKFVLQYKEKPEQENIDDSSESGADETATNIADNYKNQYSAVLLNSKNVILRGAPGTGKSYLAKEIAADIISGGTCTKYSDLSDDQKKQVEFVQFHPSYDYTDFVEGLRPKMNDDGTMSFELKDGVFKQFVEKARRNIENSKKSKDDIAQIQSVAKAMDDFLTDTDFDSTEFKTIKGNKFYVTNIDDDNIYISTPENEIVKKLTIKLDEIRRLLESNQEFNSIKEVTTFFGKNYATQGYSYVYAFYKAIKVCVSKKHVIAENEPLKKYVFIIDEINRGEMSKIFGELFFSIDPEYRGVAGEISTQYANMHSNPNEKFYIPENVYIIGTMNDIDRSVDSFDFAIRRRFRFIEIKAADSQVMLETIEDPEVAEEAIKRMNALNEAIIKVDDLNENYQIGAAYFLRLNTMTFDELWTDCLEPLLKDYVKGMYDEDGIMNDLAAAYGYGYSYEEVGDESTNR